MITNKAVVFELCKYVDVKKKLVIISGVKEGRSDKWGQDRVRDDVGYINTRRVKVIQCQYVRRNMIKMVCLRDGIC